MLPGLPGVRLSVTTNRGTRSVESVDRTMMLFVCPRAGVNHADVTTAAKNSAIFLVSNLLGACKKLNAFSKPILRHFFKNCLKYLEWHGGCRQLVLDGLTGTAT